MDQFARYQAAVQQAVAKVADEFRRSPESFLYESDLQGRLFARLFDELADCPASKPAEDYWRVESGREVLAVNPVKSEYPDRIRFDIALLDPTPARAPNVNAWNLPVRLAIEIKFWQAIGRRPPIHDDIRKLERYANANPGRRFTGISLMFSHRSGNEKLGRWSGPLGLGLNPSFEPLVSGIVTWTVTPEGPSR